MASPRITVSLLALLFLLPACRDGIGPTDADDDVVITRIGIDADPDRVGAQSMSVILVGDTVQLVAELEDKQGRPITGRRLKWSSSDPEVATVDRDAALAAVGAGSTTIEATTGKSSATMEVDVDEAGSVTVTPESRTLEPGDTLRFQAVALDMDGNPLNGARFRWETSDPAIADVEDGLVTARRAGAARITAKAGGKKGDAAVDVESGTGGDPPPDPNEAPEARFSASCSALECAFDGSGSTDDGGIVAWSWDFGDGESSGDGSRPSHVYAESGAYTVTLTVEDAAGLTDSHSASVNVEAAPSGNDAPSAAWAANCVERTCTFDGSESSDDGGITAWSWTFGDGTSGSGERPTHTYGEDGTFTVELTVSDAGGLTDTHSASVTVETTPPPPPPPPPPSGTDGIWISPSEIAALPTSGSAWTRVKGEADSSCGTPDLANQDDGTNVCIMAKALVYVRIGGSGYLEDVRDALRSVANSGTYNGRALALGRELIAYVIAADLIDLAAVDPSLDGDFRAKIRQLLTAPTSSGPDDLVDCHEDRPNNWGTHCGASRAAVAAYLGDAGELDRVATVFRGWLGDRGAYAGFNYGDVSWQCDPSNPVGINPRGCTRDGHSIDGVLPDDQRRGGSFSWPPPKENYVYEGLQGALATAVILHRRGYDAFGWSDQALLRAFEWLHEQADYSVSGDDTWQPHIVNHFYNRSFPAPTPSSPGKNVGWTDWTLR